MSRTILYYPTIEVPTSGLWIRRALLYWDHVAAIVPGGYGNFADENAIQRLTPEMRDLYERGIFRPLNPGLLFMDAGIESALLSDLDRELQRPRFALVGKRVTRQKKNNSRLDPAKVFLIYKDKTSARVFDKLNAVGLAAETGDPSMYSFDFFTGQIYMALLAKYLAAKQTHPTIPGTDIGFLLNRAHGKNVGANLEPILSATLSDTIPVPGPCISIQAILKFRKDHQAELLAFRTAVTDFEAQLSAVEEQTQIRDLTERFKERINREILNLEKALASSKMSMVLGSLQAFIKPTSPTLLGAAAVLAGKATSLATVPIWTVIAGASVAGAIEVGTHLFNKVQDRRNALAGTPFSYLFLARRKFGKW